MADVPSSVYALAEFTPVEDVVLPILREKLPDLSIQDRIWDNQTFPFVLVRRTYSLRSGGDSRFVDSAAVSISTFASDPDGDRDAAIIAEAVRVVLRDAARSNAGVAGRGHIVRVEQTQAPRRAADWATASGPVQYADLPTACWRYESRYDIDIRKPLT